MIRRGLVVFLPSWFSFQGFFLLAGLQGEGVEKMEVVGLEKAMARCVIHEFNPWKGTNAEIGGREAGRIAGRGLISAVIFILRQMF